MKFTQNLFIVCAAFAAISISSCKPGGITAEEILKKHYDAIGQEKLAKAQTVIMTATMAMMGNEMKINVLFKRPKNVRTEVSMMGATVTMITDGTKGYMVAPNQPVKDMSKDEIDKALPQSMAVDDQLYQAQAQHAKFTYLGEEKTDTSHLYKLKIDYTGGTSGLDSATAYVDAKTYYLTKLVTTSKVDGKPSTADVKFSDFRTVDGITMPYLITIGTEAMKNIPMKFEKLQYNAPIADSLFAKPTDQYAPQP